MGKLYLRQKNTNFKFKSQRTNTMKPEVTLKYLQYLRNKKNDQEGFTLIELLVVVIIIGVLAAVALPNLLGQVGKARETELKNAIGAVNRSQQSYHFERQTFSTDINFLGIKIPTEYNTDTTMGISASATAAEASSTNANYSNDGTRAFASAIQYGNGTYAQILCQSNEVTATLAIAQDATDCGASAAKIR